MAESYPQYMTKRPNRWYIPPALGIVFVVLVYTLEFSSEALDYPTIVPRMIELPSRCIMDPVQYYKLPPHGDAGFIWFIISPGIAWFVIGTLAGYLWVMLRKAITLKGKQDIPTE